MRKFLYIFLILFINTNTPVYAEKRDCSEYKKFSAKHISCKAFNVKNGSKEITGKIKKSTGNIIMKTKSTIRGVLKKD
tara:strand:- start:62 stop:295 length:234 start_codon:yes stop_codon:yes gene_type:complete